MRFVHSSDWHIGSSKFLPDYLDRQSKVIDAIFTKAKDLGINTVCIAGDVFETENPLPEERDLIQKKIVAYDQAGFNILVIPGNHDMSNMSGYTAIHYLALLHTQDKFINSTVTEKTCYRLIDDTVFILLCHTPRQFKRDIINAVNELREASIKVSYKNIVIIAHETIKGSISDTNWRMKSGAEVPTLDYGEVLDDVPVTYCALGDLHIKQQVAPKTFYCGAPLQIKFGDQHPKGILIVDTDDPNNPVFEPIESTALVRVTSLEDIPENCHVKLVTDKINSLGLDLPDNVMKLEYRKNEKDDSILDINQDLNIILLEEVTKKFEGEDLSIAKREIDELLSLLPQAEI
jgi:DNA repair exonuclease SbcCD nuclease subunit